MDLVTLRDVPMGRLLAVAGHVVSQRWNRFLAEKFNLTQAGMVTLMTLDKAGSLPHREVAQRCFVRPATLTGIIDTLERDGLVERQRDDNDRRSVRLAITPAGRERVAGISALIRSGRPLTSVDADPEKAAVIREFLLEVIGSGEEPRMTEPTDETGGPRC
ncbi:MarR family winged helix-turn-helix transcriptional regulator [Micromonospora costi]|nr:MarR family transcriptional regulator [Micromonospora costi]